MKKYLIIIGIAALTACTNGSGKKNTTLEDSLSTANLNMQNELKTKEDLLNSKEVAMTEFLNSFNEIQFNLNEIKTKEKIISASSSSKDIRKANKEQILNDIQAIYDLLDKNKKKVAGLNKKLKASNIKVNEIELAMSNLKEQLNSKEHEIANLQSSLEALNVDFANLKVRYIDEQQESELKTEKLHTAYYVIGSKSELMNKGIITKKGGFIGIGKVSELNTTIDENDFTKIDISQTMEIPIHGDKVKLVSTHPLGSYKLVEGSASIDKIMILDPEKFWSVSKYLVITHVNHEK